MIIQFLIIAISFVIFFLLQKRGWSLSKVIFTGLFAGVLYGLAVSAFFKGQSENIIQFLDIFRVSYINLLRMIVIPLILVSIFGAIIKLNNVGSLGKISVSVIGVLLLMTGFSAAIGIVIARVFKLDASVLIKGDQEESRLQDLIPRNEDLQSQDLGDLLVSFIPKNIFEDLAQLRTTSTIAIVIFAILLAIAALNVMRKNPEFSEPINKASDILNSLIHSLVRIVLAFTPYGIFATIARAVINTNMTAIVQLGNFVLASYVALGLIFVFHLLLVSFTGVNPLTYIKKTFPAFLFAFSSRSSAATIPLTVQVQTEGLGNDKGISNFAASIGASVGQNACAGLYPAMLAVMVVGAGSLELSFLVQLIVVIVISSLGVAGVGGGATNAALIVFGTLGLPIEIVALLISVEAIIDMGRTAINVNGAITAGTITSRLLTKRQTTEAA